MFGIGPAQHIAGIFQHRVLKTAAGAEERAPLLAGKTDRTQCAVDVAVRAGGHKNWGRYPFHEAAFIGGGGFFGGSQTVRGLLQNRYAGDASVYGNAEIRTRLGRMTLVLPAEVGVFALADVGRVFLDGEDSDEWHPGYGGGLWLSYLNRNNTFSITVAESEGRALLYIRLGFAF